MTDPQRKRVNRRTAWLVLFFGLWTCVLAFRLVQLQVIHHPRYKIDVIEQSRNKRPVRPRRGNITDRHGAVLALSLPAQSVFLTPSEDETAAEQAGKVDALRGVLGLSAAEVKNILARAARNERFIYLKRQVPAETAEEVRALALPGVAFHPESKRFYPRGRLASHVLGGVGVDEDGQAGVEYSLNAPLKGEEGEALVMRDARRRKYRLETLKTSRPGNDIVLTLDATIQYIAERELKRAVLASRAAWGSVVVSHPATGEILALANVPDYDPNRFKAASPAEKRNRAVQDNFEPGSTFKVVTLAAALESGAVGPAETFNCGAGTVAVPGKAIRDHKPFGILTFGEVFIHSSNIGAIQVALRTGEPELRRMIAAMGFGRKTGLELPGEALGIYDPGSRWTARSLPSISIGYEISVTALQVLQAMNIVANRGLHVPLRVVARVAGSDAAAPAPSAERILSPEAAARLALILTRSVEEGTGVEAGIPGYAAAGKTGTAQKFDPEERAYVQDRHLASFAGFIPADKPVLSIVVVIDEPQGIYYGGQVAAPVFRAVAGQALRHLKVPPDVPASRSVVAAKLAPGGTE